MSWVKTWCLDFVSTYQVYWNVPGDTLDMSRSCRRGHLIHRSSTRRLQALALDYNNGGETLTPEIDERFAKLAA